MRTVLRLLLFAAIVATIALTLAPPVRGQVVSADIFDYWTRGRVSLQTIPAGSADLSGVYQGTFTADTPGEFPHTGTIVIRDLDTLVVTAGPDPQTQFPVEKLERAGNVLRFEVTPLGDDWKVLRFDVRIENGLLQGTATLVREASGRLEFRRR